MVVTFVKLSEEDAKQLIEIPQYRKKTGTVHKFHDFYYNPKTKRFLRYISYYDCYLEKSPNKNQLVGVMTVDRKTCKIYYRELERQYPEIRGLYDPARPVRDRKKRDAADESSLVLDSDFTIGESSILSELDISII